MKNNFLLMAGLLLTSLLSSEVSAQQSSKKHRPGTVLVQIKEDPSVEEKTALEQTMHDFNLHIDKKLMKGKALRLRIGHPSFRDREADVMAALQSTGALDFAELDRYVYPVAIPNDTEYTSQWHHQKIGSESAWNYTQGSASVLVGVCDAGFDLTHPDLAGNLQLPGYNTVTDNSSIRVHPHGTQTAGVIGAIGNNSTGVTGMAWTSKILPIQVSNESSGVSTFSDMAECITYAADRGAKVVNISYDYIFASSLTDQAAQYLRGKGGVLVVAAGNAASDMSQWGSSPNMLVVGATDSSDLLTGFSNFGTPVDLVAPGSAIYMPYPGNSYLPADGTSFAAPIVSGTAALIYAIKSAFTPTQVDNFLLSTTLDLGATGADLLYARGRIQAGAAVRKAAIAADETAPSVTLTAPAAGAIVSGVFHASATAIDNIGIRNVQFFMNDTLFATATTSPYTVQISTATLPNGTYTLSAVAKDLKGNTSRASILITVKNALLITLDNLPAGMSDTSRTFTGSWCTNPTTTGSYGNASLFSCGSSTLETYRFTPKITVTRNYKVYLRYTAGSNRTATAKVTVKFSGASETKTLNMQTGGGTWVLVGIYKLDMGRTNFLQVDDSNGSVSVDGARFEAAP